MKTLSAVLGLIHGLALLPLAWFVALAVREYLAKRFPSYGSFTATVIPGLILIVWLVMSYSFFDMILDVISDSKSSRVELGEVWRRFMPIGLFLFGMTTIAINRLQRNR